MANDTTIGLVFDLETNQGQVALARANPMRRLFPITRRQDFAVLFERLLSPTNMGVSFFKNRAIASL